MASERQRRAALVTGGGKRVGRAIVEKLAGEGFDVAFTYHQSETAAKQIVASMRKIGRRAVAIRADFTQPEAAAAVGKRVRGEFDRLDLLVNNASLYESSSLAKTDFAQMTRLWTMHVWSPLSLCRELAALLKKSRGHVVNMVDLLAERPWPEYLGYCASKAGLTGLTLGLARELAPNVTVNGIAPGVVDWPNDYPKDQREKYLKRVPLARAGTPRDVADLVHFLATEGRYMTGQIIRLDGGRSIT